MKRNGTSKDQMGECDGAMHRFSYVVIRRPVCVRVGRVVSIDDRVLLAFEHRRRWTGVQQRCRRGDRIDVRAHRLLFARHVVVVIGEE